MFSESSTVVVQLPYCLGKQGELSENCLHILGNDLMAESVQGWAKEWSLGLQFFSSCMLRHRLTAGCVATKLNKKSQNLGTTL